MKTVYPYRYYILFLVAFAMALALVISWLTPKMYLATATALPASSYVNDRSRIFNENLEALYSSLGNPDDLDYVIGTAKLDTLYLSVADSLQLPSHYEVKETGPAARLKAANRLRNNTRVQKSPYGELKVMAWDKDPRFAAALANAIMKKLGDMHRDLQSASNRTTLSSLEQQAMREPGDADQQAVIKRLIQEYRTLANGSLPVLIPVEYARPAHWQDRPRTGRNLILAGGLAFVFSILVSALLANRHLSRK